METKTSDVIQICEDVHYLGIDMRRAKEAAERLSTSFEPSDHPWNQSFRQSVRHPLLVSTHDFPRYFQKLFARFLLNIRSHLRGRVSMHSLGTVCCIQHRVSGSILCPLAQPKKAIGLEPQGRKSTTLMLQCPSVRSCSRGCGVPGSF